MLSVRNIVRIENETHITISLQYPRPLFQKVLSIEVIVMQQGNVGPARLRHGEVGVAGHPHVVRGANGFDPRIRCCEFKNPFPGTVGRAIVADDDFVACDGLIEYGSQG